MSADPVPTFVPPAEEPEPLAPADAAELDASIVRLLIERPGIRTDELATALGEDLVDIGARLAEIGTADRLVIGTTVEA